MRYTTRLLAEFLAVAFVGGIGLAVDTTGITLILFPEIAALAYDVFVRPRGKWGSQPVRLIVTPTITAIVGVIITQHFQYSAFSVTVIALLSLFVIKQLRSNIGASISAGVLPMALGVTSWGYPAAILGGLVVLVIALTLWKRLGPDSYQLEGKNENRIVEKAETLPRDWSWIFALTAFVFALALVAEATGLRFLLFPPLIVVAYELFGHPDLPGWMSRPLLFPVACFLTASVGLLFSIAFHAEFWGVTLTMLCSIAILRIFRVHMPPALAVGLIPFVIAQPTFWYPVSVFSGAAALIASTTIYRLATQRSAS